MPLFAIARFEQGKVSGKRDSKNAVPQTWCLLHAKMGLVDNAMGHYYPVNSSNRNITVLFLAMRIILGLVRTLSRSEINNDTIVMEVGTEE